MRQLFKRAVYGAQQLKARPSDPDFEALMGLALADKDIGQVAISPG